MPIYYTIYIARCTQQEHPSTIVVNQPINYPVKEWISQSIAIDQPINQSSITQSTMNQNLKKKSKSEKVDNIFRVSWVEVKSL